MKGNTPNDQYSMSDLSGTNFMGLKVTQENHAPII